jgi:tetratricopeptide (TPR) repeat protein
MSQEELAERSGLSIRTIGNLERGRAKWPHPNTVRRLADALGLPAEERAEFAAVAGRPLVGGEASPEVGGGASPEVGGEASPEVGGEASPEAGGPGGKPAEAGGERVAPRQLPGPVRQFTGRHDELAALTGLLDQAATEPMALITAIGGMAGVGKTALAVHWAHRVARQFSDGQLYVDLRGYDPSASPIPASDALAGFLRALGVAGQDIPDDVDERAAAYRSLLAGRRLLVVLDNARRAEQVRPLLPGSPACVTLVTSRDALGGLVAGAGAVRLEVGLLPLPEAVGLLRGLIGRRVDDEPDAAVELADQCGRLPLALRVAAQLAVTRGGVPLADLTAELADLRHRLDLLETGGDERTTVRAVFAWSYQDLDPAAARMFRLIAIHPGPDISAAAAASLAGLPLAQARPALGELTRAHLLNEHSPGRFSCHDLLRVYGGEQAAAHDSRAEQRAATHRVLDHYLHTASAGDHLLHPDREPLALPPPQPGVLPERPAGLDEAMAWFDAEHQVLLAAVAHAASSGFSRHAWQLSLSLASFLELRGYLEDMTNTLRIALAAATSLEDQRAQALISNELGFACLVRGHYADAAPQFERAFVHFRALADQKGEARVHLNVSWLLERQGRHADAVRHDRRALEKYQAIGHKPGQALALNAAGWHLALLGEYQQALASCEQALAIQREGDDRLDEANTWDSIGYIHDRLGRHDRAIACYQEALRLLARNEGRYRQTLVLTHLGDTQLNAGNPQAARDSWRQALVILNDLHHPDAEAVRAKLATLGEHGAPQQPHMNAGR